MKNFSQKEKGKSFFTTNNSYQSTNNSHNFFPNFQASFENPYSSLYFQNSRRGSYDTTQGGGNFSGFFSPSNPGNFYSFEQPIVFNAISNINVQKPKKKHKQNESFRNYYLDTIREVYKPRHTNTHDFSEKMPRGGYLQSSVAEKMNNIRVNSQTLERNPTKFLDDSGNESLFGEAKTKSKEKNEEKPKFFLLPEIEKNKKKTTSLEKENSYNNFYERKNSESLINFDQKTIKNSLNTSRSGSKDVLKLSARSVIGGTSKQEALKHKKTFLEDKKSLLETKLKFLEKNQYFKEKNRKDPSKTSKEITKNPKNQSINIEKNEKNADFVEHTKQAALVTPDDGIKKNNENLPNEIQRKNANPFVSLQVPLISVDSSPNFRIKPKKEDQLNLVNSKNIHETENSKTIELQELEQEIPILNINLIDQNQKIENNDKFNENFDEKNIKNFEINSKNPEKNEDEYIKNLSSSSNSKNSSHENSLIDSKNSKENHLKNNIDSKTDEILIDSPKEFKKNETNTNLNEPQTLKKTVSEQNILPERNFLIQSQQNLSPTQINVIRRGTNTNGIENSLSFMKKILDSQENQDNEPENLRKKLPINRKKLDFQRMDSLTLTTSTPSNRTDIKLNFFRKNQLYSCISEKKFGEQPIKKENARTSKYKINQNFRKKQSKFQKLLTNLLNSLKSPFEETTSFIFIEPKYQSQGKPLLNLKEILRKKTIDEQISLEKLPSPPSKYPSSSRLFMRSGTFVSEKLNSGFSFSSPKTTRNSYNEGESPSLGSPVFLINVHPPTKNDVIIETMENLEDDRTLKEEFGDFRRKTEEMKALIQEEQEKMMKLQVFNYKKLWKLSLGFTISNYKGLIVTEKEYVNNDIGTEIRRNFKITHKNYILNARKSNEDLKNWKNSAKIYEKLNSFELNTGEIDRKISSDQEEMSLEMEDENFEEVFEQDGDFIHDLKRSYSESGFKFLHQTKLEGALEPLNLRKKLNKFFDYIKEAIIPLSTKLNKNFVCQNPPKYELEGSNFNNCGLDFNETFHSFKKNDTIINDTPEALRDFYKSHYLYYFSINGIFEDEIYIPIFDAVTSPTMKKEYIQQKQKSLHIPLESSNKDLTVSSASMLKSQYTLKIKEEHSSPPSNRNSKILIQPNKTPISKIKTDRNINKPQSPINKTILEESETAKESERHRNAMSVPFHRIDFRTHTTMSENLVLPHNEENNSLTPFSPVQKDDKVEKKLSFSIDESARLPLRKDGKDINPFRFIHTIKKFKERKNLKHSKTAKNITSQAENESSDNNNNSNSNNSNKMDQSSLFFRNQLINLNKIKNLNPIDQVIWAIKHNNIHKVTYFLKNHDRDLKVEELFISYPSIAIDSRDEDDGNTLLNLAAQIGNLEIVNLFLVKGANVNLQNLDGNTALHLALSYNNYQIADKLIAFGAQENIKNNDGKTPWDMYSKK